MLVCDMNDHPEKVGNYIKEAWKLLKPNSKVVITLKLKINDNLNKTYEECLKIESQLSDLFYDIKIQWLFANSTHERTLFASSRDASSIRSVT